MRVTAGHGGEVLLILGEEKTALYDCGMAYCHDRLIKNIEEQLRKAGREEIDLDSSVPYALRSYRRAALYSEEMARGPGVRSGKGGEGL